MLRKISEHPEVQAKLHLELLTSLPTTAEKRTMAMLDTLPYLNAVIMEGLRLVDTILSYETRIVPPEGCVIEGYFLPAGVCTIDSNVFHCSKRQHADHKYFRLSSPHSLTLSIAYLLPSQTPKPSTHPAGSSRETNVLRSRNICGHSPADPVDPSRRSLP